MPKRRNERARIDSNPKSDHSSNSSAVLPSKALLTRSVLFNKILIIVANGIHDGSLPFSRRALRTTGNQPAKTMNPADLKSKYNCSAAFHGGTKARETNSSRSRLAFPFLFCFSRLHLSTKRFGRSAVGGTKAPKPQTGSTEIEKKRRPNERIETDVDRANQYYRIFHFRTVEKTHG